MSHADDHPETAATAPMNPEHEELFGFASESWAQRIRHAHQPRPSLLGGYEILGELGRGGQGEVYRAVQPTTGRVVAIKRISGLGLAPDPAMLARFTREVEAQTRLNHPNVVTVYTLEVIDGHSLLVMELVEGAPIDQWADRVWASGQAPLRTILTAFAAICDGIAHAHQRGVIHRDIKPSNILVNGEGLPKVLDFGIARLLGEQAAAGAAAARPVWTVTGFAGTPAYASPEQFQPGPGGIDTRSDVYSLGVLLFRLLTGREAFATGKGLAELIREAQDRQISAPSSVRRGLPSECDWIVRKATEREPDRRYRSADELADDVRRLLDGRAIAAHPPSLWYTARSAIRRRPRMIGGITLAAVSISALSIVSSVQALRLAERSRELAAAAVAATEAQAKAEAGERRQTDLLRQVVNAAMGAASDDHFVQNSDVGPRWALRRVVLGLNEQDDPGTRADLHMRYGFALMQDGEHAEAEEQLRLALAICEAIDDPASERACRTAARLSTVLSYQNRRAEALEVTNRAIARADTSGRTAPTLALWWQRMGLMSRLEHPPEAQLAAAREFIARTDEHEGLPSERARAREESGGTLRPLGYVKLSEQLLREALDIAIAHDLGRRDRSRFRAALGLTLMDQGRYEEAEPLIRAAAEYRLELETAHGGRATRYARLHAEVLHELGRFEEAVHRWELALVRPLAAATPDQRDVARLRLRLAAARLACGQRDAARVELARAVSLGRAADPEHPDIAPTLRAVQAALEASEGRIADDVRIALGELAWMGPPLLFEQVKDIGDPGG